MESKKLIWRWLKAYNRLLSNPNNSKMRHICRAIMSHFDQRGWMRFWEKLNYYLVLQDKSIVAVPPLVVEPPVVWEAKIDGQINTMRLIDGTIKPEGLPRKSKLAVQMILAGILTNRLLKEKIDVSSD